MKNTEPRTIAIAFYKWMELNTYIICGEIRLNTTDEEITIEAAYDLFEQSL